MNPSGKRRILIADDDADIRELVGFYLEKAGYEVHYAVTGPETLTLARETRPEVILLDVMMPGLDGYHVSQNICDSSAGAPPVIVIMTARDTQKEAGLIKLSGAAATLQKPFKLSAVKEMLDSLFPS